MGHPLDHYHYKLLNASNSSQGVGDIEKRRSRTSTRNPRPVYIQQRREAEAIPPLEAHKRRVREPSCTRLLGLQ